MAVLGHLQVELWAYSYLIYMGPALLKASLSNSHHVSRDIGYHFQCLIEKIKSNNINKWQVTIFLKTSYLMSDSNVTICRHSDDHPMIPFPSKDWQLILYMGPTTDPLHGPNNWSFTWAQQLILYMGPVLGGFSGLGITMNKWNPVVLLGLPVI